MKLSIKTLQALKASCLIVQRRSMAYVSNFKPPTMNDLPVPSGSWERAHAIKQKGYNLSLAAGILLFSATLGVYINSGIINFGRGPLHLIGKDLD